MCLWICLRSKSLLIVFRIFPPRQHNNTFSYAYKYRIISVLSILTRFISPPIVTRLADEFSTKLLLYFFYFPSQNVSYYFKKKKNITQYYNYRNCRCVLLRECYLFSNANTFVVMIFNNSHTRLCKYSTRNDILLLNAFT